jgi:hypothetical protein
MPFIAIAVLVSLFLGGTAAAAQSTVGHTAIEHMSSVWSDVQASVGGNSDAEDAGGTRLTDHEQNNLRVRDDADAEAQAQDDALNVDADLHAKLETENDIQF